MGLITSKHIMPQGNSLKELMPYINRKYGTRSGYKTVYNILRLTDVIDSNNIPLSPYDDMRLFDTEGMDIVSRRGDYITYHQKLLLTKRGIVFIGRHLQKHEKTWKKLRVPLWIHDKIQ